MVFDTILYDTQGIVTLPGTLRFPVTGCWLLVGAISFALNNTPVALVINVNGTPTWAAAYGGSAVGTAVGMRPQIVVFDQFSAGDSVALTSRQDSGGNLAPQAGIRLTYFGCQLLGAGNVGTLSF